MEKNKRNHNKKELTKLAASVCFIVSLLFTAVLIILLDFWGISHLPVNMTFNLGADIVSLGVCTVLLFSFMLDDEGQSVYTRRFMMLVIATSSVLFSDACCWLADQRAEFRTVNIIVNVLNFSNAALLIFFLERYLFTALQLEGRLVSILKAVMTVLLIPDIISCLVNLFYPLYFSVNEAGVYSRSPLFPISQIYPIIGLFFCGILQFLLQKHR